MPSQSQRMAHRFRWLLLAAGLLFQLAAIAYAVAPVFASRINNFEPAGLLYSPLVWHDVDETGYTIQLCALLGLLFLGQWFFLRPSRLLPIRLTAHGRPMRGSVIVAAAMIMLLTLGAFSLICELIGAWEPWFFPKNKSNEPKFAAVWVGMVVV